MGDRTSATLKVWGISTSKQADEIYDLISGETGESKDDIRKALESAPRSTMNFHHVYPDDHEEFTGELMEAGLSFYWRWSSAGDYDGGFVLHNAATGHTHSYGIHDGDIVIKMKDIEKPGAIDRAKECAALLKKINAFHLRVTDSAHERIALLEEQRRLAEQDADA